jgi:hypothetical protein
MVLEDGSAKWTQAGAVQGLFEIAPPVSPAIVDVLPANPPQLDQALLTAYPQPSPVLGPGVAADLQNGPDRWLAKRIGVKSPVGQSIVLGGVPVAISLVWLMLLSREAFLGWLFLSVSLFVGAAIAGGIGGAIQSSKGQSIWAGARLGLFWYDLVIGLLFVAWFVLSFVCGLSLAMFQTRPVR